ncbi:MAG: MBL fold metallo-hydrolase [Luminiphilus sp.]|jgi:glyoxylase-like metal-dependent hydrolase (beta-lactamase superfamily II)|nr:MBL fold metallo-hydrolase [Luminiphilus sp.]MBL6902250.1 MBL fold metallo-hydrolase [Luminiphilus sp.]MDA0891406.1 MBL fold metallo-hydrolase [Pseudomonadota bacterium]RCL46225.1 MAG: MBL fold metallo-hydrolase [Halieaceae bacterium]CAI8368294.1 MAG: Hydroxyacylglutathione hydrolase GloC [Halieaceae bacterium]|tara:strand:- start:497 stop:1324 length:828 start_codon:yes stop_codon:yes gene_type:complete
MQEYAEAVRISPRIQRLVAPNPGVMTGPGTNTYIVGTDELAVIDPGPAIDEHIEHILKVGDGRIRHILCTHTHPDHSPAAAHLARELEVPMIGAVTADDQHQDLTFQPDIHLEQDAVIAGHDWSIRAIHTPGHVDNHYCFLLEEEGMVFAGDHIMNGSTVVIVPPGGNMKDYIESLQRLLDYDVKAIAPGHGEIIPGCRDEVEKLVRHRLMREAKVVANLGRSGPVPIETLVVSVYDDVPEAMHRWAQLSLLAHLLKLEVDGRACQSAGIWSLTQ